MDFFGLVVITKPPRQNTNVGNLMSPSCWVSSLFFPVHQILLHPAPFVLIKQPTHLSSTPRRSGTMLLTASSRWKITALQLQHWPCPAKGVAAACGCRGLALAGQPRGEMPLPQVAPGRLATMGYPSWWQDSHQSWSGAAPSPETLPGLQPLLWSQGFFPTTSPGLDHKQHECLCS